MKKKILFLGGSDIQVYAIKRAKELGYFVITADFLPDNPGHKFADAYYNVSTTDLDGILNLSKKLNIDGIVAYASDPAAPTVAYVGEALGLPSNTFHSVEILSDKSKFRQFLKENDIRHPDFIKTSNKDEIIRFLGRYDKCLVKAVDSSGSKGITVIEGVRNIDSALKEAFKFSRKDYVTVEEYIEKKSLQINGELIVEDGKILFSCYGNVHFDARCNDLVPYSITLPMINSDEVEKQLDSTLNKIFSKLKIKLGVFNVDAIVSKDDKLYIIEIGARNGGNMFTELINFYTSVNIVDYVIQSAVGDNTVLDKIKVGKRGFAHYVIHSLQDGILEDLEFKDNIDENIILKVISKRKGDIIKKFNGSNTRIGVLLLKFESQKEMFEKILNMDNYIKVKIK
jgi:biotin carboxylase